ncbi:hypothetical protein SLA2020_371990 [Shorea laevis]
MSLPRPIARPSHALSTTITSPIRDRLPGLLSVPKPSPSFSPFILKPSQIAPSSPPSNASRRYLRLANQESPSLPVVSIDLEINSDMASSYDSSVQFESEVC